jgi:hypothetical protein
MPLPAQTRPEAEQVQADQARAVLAEGRPGTCRAEYRSVSRPSAAAVSVVISVPERPPGQPKPGMIGSGGVGAGQHAKRGGYILQAALMGEDETLDAATGVGSLGGIATLAERDRFLVPGWAVGRPAEQEVLLTAHLGGRAHGGLWVAEVSP